MQEEDITPGGEKGQIIKLKTLSQGSGWQKPTDSCSVEFKISIAAADSTPLFSSDDSVLKGRIGLGEFPEAYEAALQSMKQGKASLHFFPRCFSGSQLISGEVALVKSNPEFLFVHGMVAPPNVPSDQPLLLTIELLSMSKEKESYSMSHAEKLDAGRLKKDKANAVFKAGNYK
jgi:hypothetical protein